MIKKVGIIGRGAVGIMYAKALMEALGYDNVYIIVDEARFVRYTTTDLLYNQKPLNLNYKKSSDIHELDLLIFTVKYPALKNAMHEVRNLVFDNTIVMSFLNGVISEQEILETLKPKHLLYTTVQGMDATFADNNLSVSHLGYISFGMGEGSCKGDIEKVATLFDKANLKYEIPADIKHQLFSKWMLNVGVNQACAYYGVGYEGVQKAGEIREAMLRAMREAQMVAKECGVILTDKEIDHWVALMDSLDPKGAPSMEQDRRANRINEVGLFAKTVCELGRKFNIDTPQNQIFLKKLSENPSKNNN